MLRIPESLAYCTYIPSGIYSKVEFFLSDKFIHYFKPNQVHCNERNICKSSSEKELKKTFI